MRLINSDKLIENLKWLNEYDHIISEAVRGSIDIAQTVEAIPIEWIKNKIDETEDKLFELTKDKSRPYSVDEIYAFTDLDQYAYTLKKIYYDYTGEYYEGNHYMLREKENETN